MTHVTPGADREHFPHPNAALPFSEAVRIGGIVYLSGQIGVAADGVLPDGIAAQTHQAMRNLAASAERAGTSLKNVVKCTVMLADMAMWPEFNEAYLSYFDSNRLPARCAFGVDGLAFRALVEVEAIAVAERDSASGA